MLELSETVADWVFKGSSIAVIIGGILVYWSSVERERHGSLKTRAHVEATEKSKADQLRLEQELTKAKTELQDALLTAKKVEAKQRPRSITPEQSSKGVALLKPEPKGLVRINVSSSDTEAVNYANELYSMLQQAGQQVEIFPFMAFYGGGRSAPEGLILAVRSEPPPDHAVSIKMTLQALSIPLKTTCSDGIGDDALEIHVGTKPEPEG